MKNELKIVLKQVVSNAIENLAKNDEDRQSIINTIVFEKEIEKLLENADKTEQLSRDSE